MNRGVIRCKAPVPVVILGWRVGNVMVGRCTERRKRGCHRLQKNRADRLRVAAHAPQYSVLTRCNYTYSAVARAGWRSVGGATMLPLVHQTKRECDRADVAMALKKNGAGMTGATGKNRSKGRTFVFYPTRCERRCQQQYDVPDLSIGLSAYSPN